ncbi:MAG: hypothetical protein GXP35_14540 [Actinobacteria bacterium]|nr:hypothetical protein [Actinomycetota bacterium]
MALVNVVKKVEKARDELGLLPGEEILAACTTNAKGTMKRMAIMGGIGGVVGAGIAAASDRKKGGEEEVQADAMAERYPGSQLFLVVTDRRMLATTVGAMSGKPKAVAAEWTRDELSSVEVERGKIAHTITINFADGSAVVCESPRGSDPDSLAAAL